MFEERTCRNCMYYTNFEPSFDGWTCDKTKEVLLSDKAPNCEYFNLLIENIKNYHELDWYDIKHLIAEKYNTTAECVKFYLDTSGNIHCKVFIPST